MRVLVQVARWMLGVAWRNYHVQPLEFLFQKSKFGGTKCKKYVCKIDNKKINGEEQINEFFHFVIAIEFTHLHTIFTQYRSFHPWFQHCFAQELGQQELPNIEAGTCIIALVLQQTCNIMDNYARCTIRFQFSLPFDWMRSGFQFWEIIFPSHVQSIQSFTNMVFKSIPSWNPVVINGRLNAAAGIATSCAREDAMVSKRGTIEVMKRPFGMVGNGVFHPSIVKIGKSHGFHGQKYWPIS